MSLPKPELDKREFDQLMTEARGMIARLAPTWTDHNASDPGITLLELLAYFAEILSYRLDRRTEALVRGYLRLIGIAPRAARVAETALILAGPGGTHLPQGLQLTNASGEMVFQTVADATLSPARLVAVVAAGRDRTAEHAAGTGFLPFGPEPAAEAALYLGFDAALGAPDSPVSVWVWTFEIDADRLTRQRLEQEWNSIAADTQRLCLAQPHGAGPWWLHYSARTVWEYPAVDGRWHALPQLWDETRGLTLTGPVSFAVPPDHARGRARGAEFWVRCRLCAGNYECPPRVVQVALNGVPVRHGADHGETVLGRSRGHAAERYAVPAVPILAGHCRLELRQGARTDPSWEEQSYWDLSGPHDRHYVVDYDAGEVRFGDGRWGRVPPAGYDVVLAWRQGGGDAGNVNARTLALAPINPHNSALVPNWTGLAPRITVRQPFAASGGGAAESLEQAIARAIAWVANGERAVTLKDYERLARAVPGVPVARARALSQVFPPLACFSAAGSITVVVVPNCSGPRPTPGPDFLAAVAAWLERRRTVTTEVHVAPPRYRTVAIHATLHAMEGEDREALGVSARNALDTFLHPLHGGPGGHGWPIGRDVYRAEVMECLAALPGVASVSGLGLLGEEDAEPRCGNFPVCPDGLPAAGAHDIRVVGLAPFPIIDRSRIHECP